MVRIDNRLVYGQILEAWVPFVFTIFLPLLFQFQIKMMLRRSGEGDEAWFDKLTMTDYKL
jgi:hypothetical protein